MRILFLIKGPKGPIPICPGPNCPGIYMCVFIFVLFSGGDLAPSLGGGKKFSRTWMTFFPEKISIF